MPPLPSETIALTAGEFESIPESFDPITGTTGASGAIGSIRQSAGARRAFVKHGIYASDWQHFPAPPGGRLPSMFMSPLVDFAAVGDTIVVPSLPGYALIAFGGVAGALEYLITENGATGWPTFSIGNNASKDNYHPAAVFGQDGHAAAPYQAPGNIYPSGTLVDLATPIVLHLTSGATGGALKGHALFLGTVIPFPA